MRHFLRPLLWLVAIVLVLGSAYLIMSGTGSALSRLKRQAGSALVPQQTIWAETPVVESIRQMSQLVTASYYEQLPKVRTKDRQWPIPDDDLVIIYKVTIEAGFDLSRLPDNAITLYGDTAITIQLPAPAILTRRCNPLDKTVFHDSDKWSDAELSLLHQEALDEVEHNAKSDGIMTSAINNGHQYITRLLCSFGFKEENIHIYIRS